MKRGAIKAYLKYLKRTQGEVHKRTKRKLVKEQSRVSASRKRAAKIETDVKGRDNRARAINKKSLAESYGGHKEFGYGIAKDLKKGKIKKSDVKDIVRGEEASRKYHRPKSVPETKRVSLKRYKDAKRVIAKKGAGKIGSKDLTKKAAYKMGKSWQMDVYQAARKRYK